MANDVSKAVLPGWPHASSPFHEGERAVQARMGMRERMEHMGQRFVRGYVPDEHRELFEKLPYVFVGSEDEQGFVWASLLTGEPGFVNCPDAETLIVRTEQSLPNPLASLRVGQKLAVLGIELSTRRRNRANGIVGAFGERGFLMQVEQSFGNCPQYIHPREVRSAAGAAAHSAEEGSVLSPRAAELITAADTFFIATTSGSAASGEGTSSASAPEHGMDVSHRGGPAGFVSVERTGDATVLSWPDYRGNSMFCTLGNLELNPRAGVVFVDFEVGATLALTGEATVEYGEASGEAGDTGRRVRFVVRRGVLSGGAGVLRWSLI